MAGDPEPEARRRILEAVLDHPGLRLVDLARVLDLNPSLVEYHLDQLLDAEILVEATYDHRRYYPLPVPGAPALGDAEWIALLREPIPLHVALLLLESAPRTHTDITAAVGVAKSTLSFHLQKLLEVGLLERHPDGGYAPVDRTRLHRLVVAHRPVPELLTRHLAAWLRLYRDAAALR